MEAIADIAPARRRMYNCICATVIPIFRIDRREHVIKIDAFVLTHGTQVTCLVSRSFTSAAIATELRRCVFRKIRPKMSVIKKKWRYQSSILSTAMTELNHSVLVEKRYRAFYEIDVDFLNI